MLQPIDQHRDIDLLGLDVVRLDRRFVGRRCQEPSGFGLEVIGLGNVGDTRPIGETSTRSVKDDDGAALRLEVDRSDARKARDAIGPGTGRIDDDRRSECPGRRLGAPGSPRVAADRARSPRAGLSGRRRSRP